MKEFKTPEIEVTQFEIVDIITTSQVNPDCSSETERM